ncbi:MAG: hypothetical protein K6U03_01485 [Firmicutes bacterium]|nr:hypothetical protein [Bacillota bacterium]
MEIRLLARSLTPYLTLVLILIYILGKGRAEPLSTFRYTFSNYTLFLIPLCFTFVFLRLARREEKIWVTELVAVRPVGVLPFILGKVIAVIFIQVTVIVTAFFLDLMIARPQFSSTGGIRWIAAVLTALGEIVGLVLPGLIFFTAVVLSLAYRTKNDLPPVLSGLAIWVLSAFSPGPFWMQYFSPLFLPHEYGSLLGLGSAIVAVRFNRLLTLSLGLAILAVLLLTGPRAWRLLSPGRAIRLCLLGGMLLFLTGGILAGSVLTHLPPLPTMANYDAARCLRVVGLTAEDPSPPVMGKWLARMVAASTAHPRWIENRLVQEGGRLPVVVLTTPEDRPLMLSSARALQETIPLLARQYPTLEAGFRVIEIPVAGVEPKVKGDTIVLRRPFMGGKREALAVLCSAWWTELLGGPSPGPRLPSGSVLTFMPPGSTTLSLLQEWSIAMHFFGPAAVDEEIKAWRAFGRKHWPGNSTGYRASLEYLNKNGLVRTISMEELDWALKFWTNLTLEDRARLAEVLLELAFSPRPPREFPEWQAALVAEFRVPTLSEAEGGREGGGG